MLNYCRNLLRITTNDFDDEVQALINACISDLKLAGIEQSDDEIYKRAISLYVKANFGWNNEDANGLNKAYNNLKRTLATSKKFGEVLDVERTK